METPSVTMHRQTSSVTKGYLLIELIIVSKVDPLSQGREVSQVRPLAWFGNVKLSDRIYDCS